jgi:H/ACA ribonucleoprotein complex subunit 2
LPALTLVTAVLLAALAERECPQTFAVIADNKMLLAAVNKSIKRGVKEVVKALRKSPIPAPNIEVTEPVGIVILAADISPMDVISHIPVLCEEHGVPYVFVTSRAELGAAGATKRPTSVVMVVPKSFGKKDQDANGIDPEEYSKAYGELLKLVKEEGFKVTV